MMLWVLDRQQETGKAGTGKKACAEADAGADVGTGAEKMNEVVEAVSEQN